MDRQLNSNHLFSRLIRPQAGLPDPFKPGVPYLICGKGKLDYLGLFELEYPDCGIRSGTKAGNA